MSILDKGSILAANDIKKELVDVPEWGGKVYVRMMTAGERDRWELGVQGSNKNIIRASLAVHTVCDESGDLLFSYSDVSKLSAKSASALQRIFNVAVRLNRIGKDDVEDLEKN